MNNDSITIYVVDIFNEKVSEEVYKLSDVEEIKRDKGTLELLVSGKGHFDQSEQCRVADWVKGYATHKDATKAFKKTYTSYLKKKIDNFKNKLKELRKS